MRSVVTVVLVAGLLAGGSASAQAPAQGPAMPQQSAACPPGSKSESPTVGEGHSSKPLSDKLAQSNGVICPPTGLDPQMQVPPPGGGRLKVIPPPGTPGGNQNVQPK
ncbi:MAG TPA: hypothetical protein VH678_21385 [Xanthobacteraceae bacterium]